MSEQNIVDISESELSAIASITDASKSEILVLLREFSRAEVIALCSPLSDSDKMRVKKTSARLKWLWRLEQKKNKNLVRKLTLL